MSKKLMENEDFYFENGYVVFTEQYHLKKGHCCGNGCRHCPFDYDCVPEPKRSDLLQQKQLKNPVISAGK